MSINGSGTVLMEAMPNNRRPGPHTGPPMNYAHPAGPTSQCHLPPVHSSQPSINGGAWRGPPPPQQQPRPSPMTLPMHTGSPRPGSGNSTQPVGMQSSSGMHNGSLISAQPQPPGVAYGSHGQRPMPPPGMGARPLAGPPQPPPPGYANHARPISGPGSPPNMPPMQLSGIGSPPNMSQNGSRNGGESSGQRPQMAPHPPPPQHQQQQHRNSHPPPRRGPRVASVARGPQPTLIEPTRLRDGRKIRDVQRQQQQQQQQQNGGGGGGGGADAQRGPHRFTGPGKNGMAAKNNNNNHNNNPHEPRPIKTTVGNDESWVKGLTYSTWVDSPRGNLNDLDVKDGPYKRQAAQATNNRRRKPQKKDSSSSTNSGGVMEMLRNLFR